MIPASDRFDQSTMAALLVADYRAFFDLFDWSVVACWQADQSACCGSHGHPLTAYLKAFLIRIKEGLTYSTRLRDFLLKHPLLVIELGFQLHLDATLPYGFDVEKSLPTRYWLGEKLRQLDHGLLTDLLAATVRDLKEEIAGLGETLAVDVKHIYAWVRENNPHVYVDGPYNVKHIPRGDPDCRLGIKKSRNQEQPDGSTKEKKEGLFGYGTGVAVSTDPVYGEVVHAEYTQSFNAADVSYYRPLFDHSVLANQQYPAHVAADAAYDFWYVYHSIATTGKGIAAVAPNDHGQQRVRRDADGTPYCSKGWLMAPSYRFQHTRGYQAQRFRCPLLFPEKTGQSCDHEQFLKGKGCVKDANMEKGGIMRSRLDRDTPLYHAVYIQRTGAERINSRAKELGIERPRVRNIRSVRNLNTLIYLVLNVRTLAKAKSINKGLLQMN